MLVLETIAQIRRAFFADPAGHYAKRDSTRLLINRKKQRPVMSFDDAPGWKEVEEVAETIIEAAE